MMSKLLPLHSYEIYKNKKDLLQPHDEYLNQDLEKIFFADISENDNSLQEGSQSPLPVYYEAEYKTKDFFNKIPKKN
jgi:hypothetical protein